MRRAALFVALAALLLISPPLAVLAAVLYAARYYIYAYSALWRQLVKCELYTPALSALGAAGALLSPYSGAAKALLLAMGAVAVYLAPTMPRLSRAVSVLTLGMAVETPAKPLVLVLAVAVAYLAYRRSACGFICQRTAAAPDGDVYYDARLGLVCLFAKGGRDLHSFFVKLGGSYIRCFYSICRKVNEEAFRRGVGTLDRYLPEPAAADFKGLIHFVGPPEVALKLVERYFGAGVAYGAVDAPPARLASLSSASPEVAVAVLETALGLTPEQTALVKDLLSRRSREEAAAWSLRYPWLRPILELWNGGAEPRGVAKSALPGRLGLADALLYAKAKNVPLVTDSGEAAQMAAGLGITVFLIADRPRGNFVVVGPTSLEVGGRRAEVAAGRFLAQLGGELYADDL
ncbi:hypothetical protein [Pyrobaculum neutrophilum]|uniref:Uncharacterized protein n=1 Tax=Pyrobaculum neutrophilum (strain DSM 2338 / JCM 9278 / NBRC 100436 / V24Sta) TaxID=444157 RepID=B1Y9Z0_PYRNV|nr:hypothetical protein [Pyrobaculum neutrophilum]ACB40540.1 conserved hypothetical protein [Pyrobaculum neutrophilum V24Sta]